MGRLNIRSKLNEWLKRYLAAEILGSLLALLFAWVTFKHSQSYLAAAAAGFAGEGAGFYGYFIYRELRTHNLASKGLDWPQRIFRTVSRSTASLMVEFAPAGAVCGFFILPLATYMVPQYIKPYGLGFMAGKLVSDIIYYNLAIAGYEAKQWWRRRQFQDRPVMRLETAMEYTEAESGRNDA